jgi:hypothetical protein
MLQGLVVTVGVTGAEAMVALDGIVADGSKPGEPERRALIANGTDRTKRISFSCNSESGPGRMRLETQTNPFPVESGSETRERNHRRRFLFSVTTNFLDESQTPRSSLAKSPRIPSGPMFHWVQLGREGLHRVRQVGGDCLSYAVGLSRDSRTQVPEKSDCWK